MRISDWSSDVCSSDLQSLEPLRHVVPEDDRRGRRAIEIIDQCCARLGQLVVEARRSIEAAALMADPPTEQIDLGEVVAGLVEDMRGPSEAADVHLEAHVERDVIVFGGDEAIETIVENLIDNARSEEHTSELKSLMRISYAVFC